MEKKLLPALILSLLAGTALADSDSSGLKYQSPPSATGGHAMSSSSDSSASKSTSGRSDTGATNKTISGASASPPGSQTSASLSVDASRLSELSADPHVALFNRIDSNRDGLISNQELSGGRDKLTLSIDAAGSAGGKGIDLTNFKNAITNSMLGLTAGGASTSNMASSPTDTSSGSSSDAGASYGGNVGATASTNTSDRNVQGAAADSGGMLNDKAMDNVEKQGGPTMKQGGPNPSSSEMTPEQKLNNPTPSTTNTP